MNIMASSPQAAAATAIPIGQDPPLFTITPIDQAGTIVVVTGICLVVAVVSILVRAYVLVQSVGPRLNWDDWAIGVALLFAIIQSSLVQKEANTGLGRTIQSITNHEAQRIQQTQFADQIFYVLSVWASKISVALFLYRLSPRRSDHRMSQGTMIFVGTTCITAIMILSFVCNLSQPWQYFTPQGLTCTTPYGRWVAVTVMDILSELALAFVTARIIWFLQARPTRKIVIAFVFFQRLAIIGPTIAQLHFLSITYSTGDPTLRATYSTLCKEVEVAFAITAACVPCFRPFLNAMATHYGAPAEGAKSMFGQYADAAGLSNSHSSHSAGLFSLKRLNSNKKEEIISQQHSLDEQQIRKEHFGPRIKSQYTVTGGGSHTRDAASIGSNDSRMMIIRKEINYNVRYCDEEIGE